MSKPKIIIIDDEQELLDLLKMSMEMEGYEVITAIDGEEGLKVIEEHKPDLIICDIVMPKLDGYDVLKAVREKSERWIPFIMLSAVSDFNKIKKAHEESVDFYLTKPVQGWILTKNIRALLNISKQRKEDSSQ